MRAEASAADQPEVWEPVCQLDQLESERGAAALVHGRAIALFRIDDLSVAPVVYAVDHICPRTGSPTMARGIVGSADGWPTVAAPLLKERYELETGRCLNNEAFALGVYPTRVRDGMVEVRTNVMLEKFV